MMRLYNEQYSEYTLYTRSNIAIHFFNNHHIIIPKYSDRIIRNLCNVVCGTCAVLSGSSAKQTKYILIELRLVDYEFQHYFHDYFHHYFHAPLIFFLLFQFQLCCPFHS